MLAEGVSMQGAGGRSHRVAFSFVLIMWVVAAAAEAEKTLQNKILAVSCSYMPGKFFFSFAVVVPAKVLSVGLMLHNGIAQQK